MTRRTNTRIAGAAFLLYIALGISAMVLSGRASRGETVAARLAAVAEHETYARVSAVLTLFATFMALVLGVTLYAITRDEDRELAMLGLTFRVAEGVVGGISVDQSLGLLWLATATGASAPDVETGRGLAAFLMAQDSPIVGATFFAVGSTLFSWLLLRGRMIPAGLAWLGVVASVLLVVGLPLQLGGLFGGRAAWLLWLPMLVFEVALALWLLIKGVAAPAKRG